MDRIPVTKTIIKFTDLDVDGSGTNIDIYMEAIKRGPVDDNIYDKIVSAISDYKNENEGEWDTDGCLFAAESVLRKEGYETSYLIPNIGIEF